MTAERDSALDSLLGAYALDALDEAERARVEEYVTRNPDAQAEVDELRETAAALALAPVDDTSAPPELWERIQLEIQEPDELAVRRAGRARRVQLWVVPVAAAVALVVGLGLATVVPNDDQDTAFDAAVDDGARVITLSDGGTDLAEIALLDDGVGVMRNEGLDALSDDEVYQLWALVGEGDDAVVVSAGVLGANPTDAPFMVAGAVQQFMVTVEAAPGVAVSNQDPVAISA